MTNWRGPDDSSRYGSHNYQRIYSPLIPSLQSVTEFRSRSGSPCPSSTIPGLPTPLTDVATSSQGSFGANNKESSALLMSQAYETSPYGEQGNNQKRGNYNPHENERIEEEEELSHSAKTLQIPAEYWEKHRQVIRKLYVDNGQSLKAVSKFMAVHHRFRATDRQYKRKIRDWNLDKKVKDHEMRAILATSLRRRIKENKDSIFFVRGQRVDKKKIDRYAYRRRKENSTLFRGAGHIERFYDLPPGVECRTPPNGDVIYISSGDEEESIPRILVSPADDLPSTQEPPKKHNDPPAPKPTQPGVRSRNGCWSCKSRKVRCDEIKPSCMRCAKHNRQCDYSIRLNWQGRLAGAQRRQQSGTPEPQEEDGPIATTQNQQRYSSPEPQDPNNIMDPVPYCCLM